MLLLFDPSVKSNRKNVRKNFSNLFDLFEGINTI